MTELGNAIGEPTLPGKLRHARKSRQLPDGRVLAAIAGELDPVGRNLLVEALAWDAQLPGFEAEAAEASRRVSSAIRALEPVQQEALFVLLGLNPSEWRREDDQERREAADELTRLNQEMGLLNGNGPSSP